ncbi:MAG: hypothetical protein ACUVV6_04070 [Thermoplasmatota archaeon]
MTGERGAAPASATPLTELLASVVSDAGDRIGAMERRGRREWERFSRRAERAGMSVDVEALRAAMASELQRWPEALEPDWGEVREMVEEVFGAADPVELPVYVSPDLTWHIFRTRSGRVEELLLREDGSTAPVASRPLDSVPLLGLDEGGGYELRRYLSLLNRRDPILAAAALVTASGGFEEELDEVYWDALRDCALDVWWRASLLGISRGLERLGASDVGEGVVFCDADFLDMSGVGGVL